MLSTVVMGLKKPFYKNLNQASSIFFVLTWDQTPQWGKKAKKKTKKYRLGSLRTPNFFSFFSNAEPGSRLSFSFHSPSSETRDARK